MLHLVERATELQLRPRGGRRRGRRAQEAGSRRAVGKLLQEYHASRFSELNVKAQVTQAQ